MRRSITLFIRYKSLDNDEIYSRFMNIHITEIPIKIRKEYAENRNLEYVIKWYLHKRYCENSVEIISMYVLNSLDDWLCESV